MIWAWTCDMEVHHLNVSNLDTLQDSVDYTYLHSFLSLEIYFIRVLHSYLPHFRLEIENTYIL